MFDYLRACTVCAARLSGAIQQLHTVRIHTYMHSPAEPTSQCASVDSYPSACVFCEGTIITQLTIASPP
jgi:hypothetical protein